MRLRSKTPAAELLSFSSKPLIISAISMLVLALGCQRDEVTHYRVPKESVAPAGMPSAPAGMPPPGMGAPGDVPPPPRPTGQGALKWTLPKGWTEGEAGGMRYATLKPPIQGKVEASVVVLPGAAGGELSNVNRWRGQIGLGPLDEKALAVARKTVKSKAGMVSVFDFTSEGQTKTRMVAGLISTSDGNSWFLKLVGDAAPVGKAEPDFMRIIGSLHLD